MIVLWILLGLIALILIAGSAISLGAVYSFLLRRPWRKVSPLVCMPPEEETAAAYDALKEQGLTGYFCESNGKKLYAEFLDKGSDKVALLLHGLHGCGRDRAVDALYYANRGYSILLADLRACGRSEGHFCDMGIYTREDMLVWCELLKSRLGPDCRIVADGVSMGAASALLLAGDGKCPNLRAVIADSPYSSFEGMCRAVCRKLPGWLFAVIYPFERFWCRVLLGRDLNHAAPIHLMDRMQTPVLFLHSETDTFVPCEMSRTMYNYCVAPKQLFTLPDAPHVGMRVLFRGDCETVMDKFLSKIM